MNKQEVHHYINKKAPNCEHSFIATNTKKTERHEAVTQMVCQNCLLLVNFDDVASGCQAYRECSSKTDRLPDGAYMVPAKDSQSGSE